MASPDTPHWTESLFHGLYRKVLPKPAFEHRVAQEVPFLWETLQLRKGQRVLDCPCGFGRIGLELARRGVDIVGVDLVPAYIRSARRRARQEGLQGVFVAQDMRNIEYEQEFDAVLNWFTSFGYFRDEENLDVLHRFRRALHPGGRLLMELMNKSYLQTHFEPVRDESIADVEIHTKSKWSRDGKRLLSQWTMRHGDVEEIHDLDLRTYNGTELRRLLRKAGFVNIRLCDRQGKRFTRHSPRLVAVAQRPRN